LKPGGGNFGPDGRYFVGFRTAPTITAFAPTLGDAILDRVPPVRRLKAATTLPPDDKSPSAGHNVTRVHPLNCATITENKLQEAANPKVGPPSATPNDRPATARDKDDRPSPFVRVRYRRPVNRRSRTQHWMRPSPNSTSMNSRRSFRRAASAGRQR